jgi:uridine kinase
VATRASLLATVAEAILGLPRARVVRVAVDGVDGAGKTTFADELGRVLEAHGRPTIRASVDGFHNPRAARYRLGRASPEGFFADSYDYATLRAALLDPLGPGGSGRYRVAAFDHRTDLPVAAPLEQATPGAILVLDGIFLLRPELRSCWDYSIFLEVGFDVSIARGAARDHGSPDPDAPENRRYVEGQRLYLRTCEPRRHATVVIDNRDLAAPFIVRPELRVRPATVNDARGIASVQVRAWRAAYAGMVPRDFLDNLSVDEREARWRQNLGGTEAMTCVAEESGGVIGWASVGGCRDEDATPELGELWAIYVAPERWRGGVGRALWTWGQQRLAERGAREIVVWVLEANHAARRFYETLGFGAPPDRTRMLEIGGARISEIRLRGTWSSS